MYRYSVLNWERKKTKMKKVIAIVLAVMMVLSLAACGGSAVDTAQLDEILSTLQSIQAQLDAMNAAAPEAEAAEEAPAEEAPAEEAAPAESADFTWNGQMEVWSILPTTGAEGLVWINDAMGAVMEGEGFTYVKKDAQGDPTAQVQFVEDAIAAGNVGALMIAAMDVDMLEDVVADALDAGIAVAMLGADPDYPISGNVYTAYAITGMFAVQAAEDWVAQRVAEGGDIPTTADGKYEVAVDDYYNIRDGVYRSNAIVGTIEKSDTLVMVSETSSYGESAYSDAYNNATDVLGAHPDCRIFVCYEPEEAMGTADAIEDYCDVNGLDLADFFVAPCYAEDTAFTEMYEASVADHAANAIKGYSTYGDAAMPYGDDTAAALGASYDALAAFSEQLNPGAPVIIPPLLTGEHLADILLGSCGIEGYEWTIGETYFDTITAVNVYGYEHVWTFGEENPAAEYEVA